MSNLAELLIRQIRQTGPITIAEYMTQCLLHPVHGYYRQGQPLGKAGDFITAPEISQMFGELVGLSIAQNWLDQGAPAPFTLCEAGPGRGVMMADILRATKRVPGFHQAMQLTLHESNSDLKAVQAERLAGYSPKWIAGFKELAPTPLFLVANEFFDCLPVRQFARLDDGWSERMIGVKDDQLSFAHGPAISEASLPCPVTPDQDFREYAAAAFLQTDLIARHIGAHGGAALIIDYGDWVSAANTLQAVSGHKKTDVLAAPGRADLTAHVSFGDLADAASDHCRPSSLVPQGVFLERLGITARAQQLADRLSGRALEQHISAHRRLTHPDEMGHLFKLLALVPNGAPLPPGCDP